MAPRSTGRLCNLCFENFSVAGSFTPIALNCGHSICSDCWQQVLSSPTNPSCPFCMKECSVSVGKNYSLIELIDEIEGEQEKKERVGEKRGEGEGEGEEEEEREEGEWCEVCGEEEERMICCDCKEGFRRQCESCCLHLHQMDRFSSHRWKERAKRKGFDEKEEEEGEKVEENKEEEIKEEEEENKKEENKEEENKEENKEEVKEEKKKGKKQKSKKKKKKTKEVSKKGSTQISSNATKILSLLNKRKHNSAFMLSFHHAWSDGDCAALLAMCHFDGMGTKISQEMAKKWSKFASESGSWFGKGIDFYVNGTDGYKDANPILIPFADEGNSLAQRCVGRCFEHLDEEKLGFEYYCKSAEQGLASGTNNMAASLEDGAGTEKDYPRALEIMTKLAEEVGWPQSLKNLGYYYKFGTCGVEIDYKKSVQFLKPAVDQGQLYAMNMLADSYHGGKGVTKSGNLAFLTYKMAHEGGLLSGTSNLGFCYANGVGVEKDDGMAVYYYTLAAEKGSTYSQKNLAKRFESGRGVEKDVAQALHYFRLAAEKGDEESKEGVKRLEGN